LGQHPRRQFLRLAVGAAAIPAVSRISWAQTYPTRPVRIIVPFAPGGGSDIYVRLLGQWLSERLAQPFIIENRPGASGNIGAEAAAQAPADGYTLLLVTPGVAINATLYDKLTFNFIRDMAPVARIEREPEIMMVNPSVPARTVAEFIAYSKANPGKINMASVGTGQLSHLSGELFKLITGVNMVHVPYSRGAAPAVADLLGGQVQVMFNAISSSIEFVRTGRLRALAVTTAMRAETLPDVPSMADFLPGYEASLWTGISAPKKTPGEIIDKLNKEVNAALADPKMKARVAELGATVFPTSPAEFGKFIAEETEKWAKVIRAAGIKTE
jgi:tripartite-type tricarboxylate transporter receptor subunit TctC